jgi:hypothetical protein
MTDTANSAPRSEYRGDLSQTPLPEVLATIHRYRAPGTIECRRGAEVKNVFIDNGAIIWASSNNLADSLGQRLVDAGRIDQNAVEQSIQRSRAEGKRQGAILVDMKMLEPKDVFVSVREQVQAIVWSIFEWEDGQVVFRPGRDGQSELIKLNVPIRQAILQGVRRVRDARMLVGRMGTKATVLQRSSSELTDLTLAEDEKNLLSHVDGRRTLLELTQTPPLPPSQNAKILYAFHALSAIAPKTPIKVQVKTAGMKVWSGGA